MEMFVKILENISRFTSIIFSSQKWNFFWKNLQFYEIFSLIFHSVNNFNANFWKITQNSRVSSNNKIFSLSPKNGTPSICWTPQQKNFHSFVFFSKYFVNNNVLWISHDVLCYTCFSFLFQLDIARFLRFFLAKQQHLRKSPKFFKEFPKDYMKLLCNFFCEFELEFLCELEWF